MNTGRNDPCPCGSGKKYKKCCLGRFESRQLSAFKQQKTAPSHHELNQLLALFSAGHHAEAEERARLLLERYPDAGFVWKVLGVALQLQGKDSLDTLRKAAELLPSDHEAHYNLGNTLLFLNRLDEAEASYQRALRIRPDDADAYFNLGNTFRSQGRLDKAAASYLKALQIRPDHAEVYGNLGNILQELGRLDEAEASYRRALQLKPGHAVAHYNLGNLLHDLNRLNEAEDSLWQALQLKPDYAEAYINLGKLFLVSGRIDEAEANFQRALEIRPGDLMVRLSLALTRKAKTDDDNLAALVTIEDAVRNGDLSLPDDDRVYLHFALGQSYGDIGAYEKAFAHFLEGNRRKRSMLAFDPDQIAQQFASIRQCLNAVSIGRLRGGGNPSSLPIFILGMPRSGTTLVEQIVSSHPGIHGAGELHDLNTIMRRNIAGDGFPDNLRSLDLERLTDWASEYVARLQHRAPDARRITDKMPENFLAVGLIHLMLPNAKIVHVERNPVDTCLSCFTQLFKDGQEFTYDLAELGRYYADYAHLMNHWRKVLPEGAFLDVQYEDLVADQEAQSRRIIEYCGLEWSDACLDFHRNKRVVKTASMSQVRQPMYKSSVERWRHYEKFLGPLLDALGPASSGRNGNVR